MSMSHDPLRDPLREALRALPREAARPGFRARTLARLEAERRPASARFRQLAWASALAAAVVVPFWLTERAGERAARQRALAELRQEQQELAAELAALKQQSLEPPGIVYLGGNEETDLVVDVVRLGREQQLAHAEPATFRNRD